MANPWSMVRLDGPTGYLELRSTEDGSRTRAVLELEHNGHGATAELDVAELQQLAGAVLQFLVDGGHQLPELPAMDEDLEDADEDSQPPAAVPPASTPRGHLVVMRTESGVRIEQADEWVEASGELLDEMAHQDTRWSTVRGLVVDLRDDAGRSCRYVVRPDLPAPSGTVVLQRTLELAERPPEPEEHHRPHSRACGIRRHDHGPECHSNCPTCGGRSAQDQVHRPASLTATGAHAETP